MTKTLFSPLQLGAYSLPNRIVMAPLTRMRAPQSTPTDLMVEYYRQRASAGLIITEATAISPQAIGYPNIPGIFTEEQVSAWQKITAAIHQENGVVFLQLWHVGRISHPDFHGGDLPVAPSAIAPQGQAVTFSGMQAFVTPRALALEELPGIVNQYRYAAQLAKAAGFDGVEIHSANGYLLDQFLRDGSNQRTDSYGGSFANRYRLLQEVTQAVVDIWGADKVGLRLSPSGTFNDMADANPTALFSYVVEQLNSFKLAYLHLIDALEADIRYGAKVVDLAVLRAAYHGCLMVCGGYDQVRGNHALAEGLADAVAYGQLYIANPDLALRFKQGAPLNTPDAATFYGGDEKGYTDYPFLTQSLY